MVAARIMRPLIMRTSYYASPEYGVEPGYYEESYGGSGGDVNYCMRRYRSYDPRSGTFMGNDGRRHPCP